MDTEITRTHQALLRKLDEAYSKLRDVYSDVDWLNFGRDDYDKAVGDFERSVRNLREFRKLLGIIRDTVGEDAQ